MGPMAALSRWLTAPRVRAFMRTPVGPNLSAAVFPELTSEHFAAQGEPGHRVRVGRRAASDSPAPSHFVHARLRLFECLRPSTMVSFLTLMI